MDFFVSVDREESFGVDLKMKGKIILKYLEDWVVRFLGRFFY